MTKARVQKRGAGEMLILVNETKTIFSYFYLKTLDKSGNFKISVI